MRLAFGCLAVAAALTTSALRADEPDGEPQERIGGRESERRLEGDTGRDVADGLLFGPREALRYFFLAHVIVARFAQDRQLVPRVDEVRGREPLLIVFPTLFAETERNLSVGLRMVTQGDRFATSHRVGFGGVDDLVAESEVQYASTIGSVPIAANVEGLAESKTELEYHGIGQTPRDDPRNRFVAGTAFERGLFEERRSRGIVSAGVRPIDQLQVQLSGSLTRRQLKDDDDAGAEALSQVFEPGSVAGWGPDSWMAYVETAVRFDTRARSGPPLPGVMAETYGGYARDVKGIDIAFARTGGRLAGYIPIYRTTNILSPKLTLDGLVALEDLPVPFTELVRQPDYRGDDSRRDFVSLVGSLDYIWAFTDYAAARIFVDAAAVGPAVEALPLDQLRVAGGGGFDIYSDEVSIVRLWLAGSADGFHVKLSVGTPSYFGDRQHRD
jgi:hypothetical protein